jgi:hypothetical protein
MKPFLSGALVVLSGCTVLVPFLMVKVDVPGGMPPPGRINFAWKCRVTGPANGSR